MHDIGAVRCNKHLTLVGHIFSQQFADTKCLGRVQKCFGFVDEQHISIGAKNSCHYSRERSKTISLVIQALIFFQYLGCVPRVRGIDSMFFPTLNTI